MKIKQIAKRQGFERVVTQGSALIGIAIEQLFKFTPDYANYYLYMNRRFGFPLTGIGEDNVEKALCKYLMTTTNENILLVIVFASYGCYNYHLFTRKNSPLDRKLLGKEMAAYYTEHRKKWLAFLKDTNIDYVDINGKESVDDSNKWFAANYSGVSWDELSAIDKQDFWLKYKDWRLKKNQVAENTFEMMQPLNYLERILALPKHKEVWEAVKNTLNSFYVPLSIEDTCFNVMGCIDESKLSKESKFYSASDYAGLGVLEYADFFSEKEKAADTKEKARLINEQWQSKA